MKCKHVPEHIPLWFSLGARNRGAICKKCGKRIYLTWGSAMLQSFIALCCGMGAVFVLWHCFEEIRFGSSNLLLLSSCLLAFVIAQLASVLYVRLWGRFKEVDPRELLPQNKGDIKALDYLSGLTDTELKPLIPELLAWMKDTNWLVCSQVARFLRRREKIVIPHVDRILRGDDYIWICNLLEDLIPKFSINGRTQLKSAMLQIKELKDENDDAQNCKKLAQSILDFIE